jgi:hypothetical protein
MYNAPLYFLGVILSGLGLSMVVLGIRIMINAYTM